MLLSLKQKIADLIKTIQKSYLNAKRLLTRAWPISWNRFKEPVFISKTFIASSYQIKILFLITIVSTLVSFGFLTYGLYLATTIPVAASGGVFREAVSSSRFQVFNPVLDNLTYAEQRVIDLLYHPLYKVNRPDFLNSTSESIEIEPVLLDQEPQWLDDGLEIAPGDGYKTLQFKLKEGLKWSDSSDLTSIDVVYTFNLLKQEGANSRFQTLLSSLTIERIDALTFNIISPISNPQLKYQLDFYPISRDFYGVNDISQLQLDPRTTSPNVTSGHYTLKNSVVNDPDSADVKTIANPWRQSNQSATYQKIVLEKNDKTDLGANPNFEKYVVSNYTSLKENDINLVKSSKEGKVHLFTLPSTNSNFSTQEILDNTDLKLKEVPSNTFYSLFFNLQRRDELSSVTIRRYLYCVLQKYTINPEITPGLEQISNDQNLVPPQLLATTSDKCPEDPKAVLADTNYSVITDDQSQITSVYITSGRSLLKIDTLRLITYNSNFELARDIQRHLKDYGLFTEVISDNADTNSRLESKMYSMALLPLTITTQDIYNLYSINARNLTAINLNNEVAILDSGFEENLSQFSQSNLSTNENKDNLIEFFKTQYINFWLARQNIDIFYNPDYQNIIDSTGNVYTFSNDIWRDITASYIVTKREFGLKL